MAAIANSLVSMLDPRSNAVSGCEVKPMDQFLLVSSPMGLSFKPIRQRKARGRIYRSQVAVRAGLRDAGKPSMASIFIGGFLLGGITMGTLACVYAPKISEALDGTDRKDLMLKLPKFIYDEDKGLEKTRKVLTDKIALLNAAIEGASSRLRKVESPNGAVVASDELEAAI